MNGSFEAFGGACARFFYDPSPEQHFFNGLSISRRLNKTRLHREFSAKVCLTDRGGLILKGEKQNHNTAFC